MHSFEWYQRHKLAILPRANRDALSVAAILRPGNSLIHYADKQGHHLLDWTLAYSYAFRDEPDRRIITNHKSGISDTNDISQIVTGNDNITRYYQSLSDHVGSLAFNYRGEISLWGYVPIIKAGLFTEYSAATTAPANFFTAMTNSPYEERNEYLYLPFEQMMSDMALGRQYTSMR